MHLSQFTLPALACALTYLINSNVQAAAYDLTVYSDEMSALGESEIEARVSLAKPRSASVSTGLVTQALTEINYGIAKGWEIGIQIPAVYSNSERKLAGIAFEMQYVAPHDKSMGWYWGVRSEIGRTVSLYEDDTALSMELNPILGFRSKDYHYVLNTSFDKALSGKETSTRFHPSAKLTRPMTPTDELGVEYYGYWGLVSQLHTPAKRDETLYFVWDQRTSFGRLNMGLGQALRPMLGSADKWVAKLGIQFETD
jgi:hypothetical protein